MPLPKNLPNSGRPAAGRPASSSIQSAGRGKESGGVVLAHRYKMEHKLGSGAFGCAYLVVDLKANCERKVLKQIVVADLQPDETVDAVREARLLAKLDHPSIVKFHDSFMERDFFCIVTEYCEGGDLDAKICQWREAGKMFEETLILDWFIQLTTAIKYIHERRVLHRDLKTRNIFLKNNLVKLGDFGISRILMGTSDLATTFTGTPYYMSPEVLKHDGYNAKSDVWSLGVVLFELCTLQHAFQGQNLMAVMYKIVEGEQPRLPDHFSPQLRALFLKTLDKDPSKRPTAVEILQEPFVQQRMERLRGKMSMRMSSANSVAEEAEAIARALSPVKKKNLIQDEKPLTPKERMQLRKRQKADQEAEQRKKMAAKNFSEGQKRFKDQKKKQMRVVPPWVEEHPDVFSDPNFSITQFESSVNPDLSGTAGSAMDVSVGGGGHAQINQEQQEEVERYGEPYVAWGTPKRHGGSGDSGISSTFGPGATMNMSVDLPDHQPLLNDHHHESQTGLVVGVHDGGIPEDPLLAETHYSQFEDFEEEEEEEGGDESSYTDTEDDDYEAFLGCIEEALELPNQPVPAEPSHDEISPFTPLARDKRIELLRQQCEQIYGADGFQMIYEYLKRARYSDIAMEESEIITGLRKIVTNVRDCFLIDQLVFLEKQAEALSNDGT